MNNELYAVIDIGSNSVRLMMHDGAKTLSKEIKITKLATGISFNRMLNEDAMDKTLSAVAFFVEKAKKQNANEIYIFASAAVRTAENGRFFAEKIFNTCGEKVEIISGEIEAEIGIKGALKNADGGIIDIGGASTEIIVLKDKRKVYSKSVDVGTVRIRDEANNGENISKYVDLMTSKFAEVPRANFYGIGGTCTTIAAMLLELETYNPNLVNGYIIKKHALLELIKKIKKLSIDKIKQLKGLQPERADVILGGAMLLLSIMSKLCINEITVSEDDNLEGFLYLKRGMYE